MKITAANYSDVKMDMLMFLNAEIVRYSETAGSREKLSIKLGHADNHVRKIMNRQSYTALERLWKECREKLG